MPNQCPKLQQLPENVRKFWEDKQRELEDTLILFSYATFVESPSFPGTGKSGILYLMEQNLWFEDFEKPPIFFLSQKSTYTKTLIQIPRHAITNVGLVRGSVLDEFLRGKRAPFEIKHNIFWRLIHSDSVHLVVSGAQDSGTSFQYIFRDLDEPESWVRILQS